MNFKAILITAWIWFLALATAYAIDSEMFQVCNSPECIQRAKLINESLNTTIDPCTDFYSYVCYQWESDHPLQGGRGSYDVYQEIVEDIPEKLSYILGNRTPVESSETIIDKVATMYNACLALPDTNDALTRVLNESGFNAWPFVSDQNIFNSSNCADLLHHMNISAILYVHLINMGEYAIGRPNPYLMAIEPMPVQEEIMRVRDIRRVINNTIKFLNPEMETAVRESLINHLVEFSQNLSNAMAASGLTRDYNISTLDAEFGNKIPISHLLKKEFEKVNITLKDTDTFSVHYIYLKQLSMFLETASPNTLYNYAAFLRLFPYLKYVQMSNERELTMNTPKSRNLSECITLLDESSPDILDYLYVTNEPNHTAIKNEVKDIASRLKQTFNETLQNNSWIDNTTREALEKKLTEVPLGIGYPDTLFNMSILETRYQYVPVFLLNISFTEALYYFKENIYKMQLRKFRYPQEGDLGWDSSARYGRTFHDKNRIMKMEIPYAVFVPPFFQQGLPRSLNYGGIGGAIAHELGDSFSNVAIDACQEIRRCKWKITEESLQLFNNLTQCFADQYKSVNEKRLKEFSKPSWFWRHTLDQDLADNTGLRTAFKAYKKVLEDECAGLDTRLTGLENLSGMRLFFISHARTMCKTADKATRIADIWRGYSPAENRVNEAMKNFEGFAEAFNCPPNSPMNPARNCTLW